MTEGQPLWQNLPFTSSISFDEEKEREKVPRSPCAFQRMRMLLTKRARMRQAGGLMLTCSTSSLRGRAQCSHPQSWPWSPPPPPDTTRWCLCSAKVICCLFNLSRVSTQKSSKGPVRLLSASCAPLARSRVALELTLGAGQSQGPAAPTLPPTKPPRSVRSPLIPSLLSGIVLSTICSSL